MTRELPPILLGLMVSAIGFALGWAVKAELGLGSGDPIDSRASPLRMRSGSTAGSRASIGRVESGSSIARGAKNAGGALAPFLRTGILPAYRMEDAVDAVLDENDPQVRHAGFSELLEKITPGNAIAAYDALEKHRIGEQDEHMQLFLTAWGRVDGEVAVNELLARAQARREAVEAGGEPEDGVDPGEFFTAEIAAEAAAQFDLRDVVAGWVAASSGAALDWFDALGIGTNRDIGRSAIVDGLLVDGVEAALAFVATLPEGDGRHHHMAPLAGEMLEDGVESAAAWAAGISEPDLRGGAMDRIAGELARHDLEAALVWIEPHAGQTYANRAIIRIAQKWAQADPEAALEWGRSLPENARDEVFDKVFADWTARDPDVQRLREDVVARTAELGESD